MSSQPPHSQKPQKVDPSLDPNRELPPDADVEEHFINFWKKQGPGIILFFVILGVGLIGFQTWNYLQERGAEKLKEQYREVLAQDDPAALLSFADGHADKELGGMAYLQVAHREFEKQDFTQALGHYQAAIKGLGEDDVFAQRARLGAAVSQLRLGDDQAGMAGLEDLSFDPNALDSLRAEAAYYLAGERWQANNIAGARQMLLLIQQLPEATMWERAAQSMLNELPKEDQQSGQATTDVTAEIVPNETES
ncbi:MAG: hypothetical protein E1N59_630 [Puniceicoccaceae bacterium 5H]|nr:MAG: hypothetical protein E1N59_630 [Puniceicoccaceae bacterium 5H]